MEIPAADWWNPRRRLVPFPTSAQLAQMVAALFEQRSMPTLSAVPSMLEQENQANGSSRLRIMIYSNSDGKLA